MLHVRTVKECLATNSPNYPIASHHQVREAVEAACSRDDCPLFQHTYRHILSVRKAMNVSVAALKPQSIW